MKNNEMLEFYKTNGYYVENIFSKNHMDVCRDECDRLLELRNEDTRPYAYPNRDSKIFNALWKNKRTLDILKILIGDDVSGLQTWIYFKPPGELGRDVHQNIFYTHANRGDIINASMAVDSTNE
jgi:hypothetical protein